MRKVDKKSVKRKYTKVKEEVIQEIIQLRFGCFDVKAKPIRSFPTIASILGITVASVYMALTVYINRGFYYDARGQNGDGGWK